MQAGLRSPIVIADIPVRRLDPRPAASASLDSCNAAPSTSADVASIGGSVAASRCSCFEAAEVSAPAEPLPSSIGQPLAEADAAAAQQVLHSQNQAGVEEDSQERAGGPGGEQTRLSHTKSTLVSGPQQVEEQHHEESAAGLIWLQPAHAAAEECVYLWLGDEEAPALSQLLLTLNRFVHIHLSCCVHAVHAGELLVDS